MVYDITRIESLYLVFSEYQNRKSVTQLAECLTRDKEESSVIR